MTKTELLKELDNICGKVDQIIGDFNTVLRELRDVFTLIENLPQDEDEIEDSKSEIQEDSN